MKFTFKEKKFFYPWLFLISLVVVTRLLGLNWGSGYFFHPDEGNMARAVSQMEWGDFNPRFFAYGQFPLYLTFFSAQVVNFFKRAGLMVTFSQASYILRFYSALFSLGTIGWGYLLFRKLEPKGKNNWLVTLWLIFSPGLIQAAHFGTTESLLGFVSLGLVYLSLQILEKGLDGKRTLLIALIIGMGLGSKVSAALFLFPVIIAFLVKGKKEKKKLSWLSRGMGLAFLSIFFFTLFCPYYLLEWQESLRIVLYEAEVAAGRVSIFYTRQFLDTLPFIFQIKKIFPWVLGWVVFILTFPGLVINLISLLSKKSFLLKKKGEKLGIEWWLFHLGWFPWFLANTFMFTKWTRFMVPVLPFFIILSFWLVSKIKSKKAFYLLLVLGSLPGLLFCKVYWTKDIRLQAMEWINNNVPVGSVIVYEGGNIIDLPGLKQFNFTTLGIDFYSLEDKKQNQKELDEKMGRADYFLSPSRRIFANFQKEEYPHTLSFYQNLFSGESGFKKVKEFRIFSPWQELIMGSDLKSEETWTVFDHPTLRLYERIR